jgi:hypothetical protein
MTMDRSVSDAGAAPATLPSPVRQRIFVYLGVLIFLLAFGSPAGGLIDIPISFLLKNKLHLQAHEVASFRLVAAIPLYLSFVFGFVRDSFNPLGMRDRGFMLLFGAISAALYALFAATSLDMSTLLSAVIALTVSFLFVASAQNGLTAALGQQHAMTGQISALWNIVLSIPTMAALLAGGMLSDRLEHQGGDEAVRTLFLVGAAIMASVALYALWRPREVFDNVHDEDGSQAHRLPDLKRLARHWPIYPALLIWLLWNFAPASTTPLQYHLQNTLHATDAEWGEWNAIFAGSFIPTYVVYGVLCRKVALRKLLWWGTVIAVPQMVPLLFIHSVTGALISAAPIGDAVRRSARHQPLRSLWRLRRLRARHHHRLRPDPADAAPRAKQAHRDRRRRRYAGIVGWAKRSQIRWLNTANRKRAHHVEHGADGGHGALRLLLTLRQRLTRRRRITYR